MSTRFRSSFAAPTGFVAAVTRIKPGVATASRQPATRAPVCAPAIGERQGQQKAA